MANASLKAAFERFWQHTVNKIETVIKNYLEPAEVSRTTLQDYTIPSNGSAEYAGNWTKIVYDNGKIEYVLQCSHHIADIGADIIGYGITERIFMLPINVSEYTKVILEGSAVALRNFQTVGWREYPITNFSAKWNEENQVSDIMGTFNCPEQTWDGYGSGMNGHTATFRVDSFKITLIP